VEPPTIPARREQHDGAGNKGKMEREGEFLGTLGFWTTTGENGYR